MNYHMLYLWLLLLTTGNTFMPAAAADFAPGSTFRDCDLCPEMVVIPTGSFTMGSPAQEAGRDNDESPQHTVNIPRPLAVGRYEVTRGEYALFAQESGHASSGCNAQIDGKFQFDPSAGWQAPGFAQNDSHPVACVNWNDAQAYVTWLSRKSGKHYRLLSEAEWEYAARAGTNTTYYWGDNADEACRHANGADHTARTAYARWTVVNCTDNHVYTAPAGSFEANAFGLHDMTGNVWEWTEDCWYAHYNGAPADGGAWMVDPACRMRVLRGGAWGSSGRVLRSANRIANAVTFRDDHYGFRVTRSQ